MTSEPLLVVMPRLSDSMEEGTVVKWLKHDGDEVTAGEELVEIETDKATMVYEAEGSGVLRQLVAEGETVRLGGPLAELLPAGSLAGDEVADRGKVSPLSASRSVPRKQANGDVPAAISEDRNQDRTSQPAAQRRAPPSAGGRVAASPVARRLARSLGIELAALLPGSGPSGRIVKRDVQRVADSDPAHSAATAEADTATAADGVLEPDSASGVTAPPTTVELTRLQATVARRMSQSRAEVPDFSVEVEVDGEPLVALQASIRESVGTTRPSYNDFVIKACALALHSYPQINGSYQDGRVELHDRINIGFAVAAEGILVVPVVSDADIKSIGTIAAETRRLSDRAREGKLVASELSGGTFTVSNMGMLGVTRFTAVINPPQAAILAVGAMVERPVVRDGEVRPGRVMALTLSADHRLVYGADAAAFLAEIRAGLEQPLRLLM